MRCVTSLSFVLLISALATAQEEPIAPPVPEDSGIAPPSDLNLEIPPADEVVPAPQGRREDGSRQERDFDLDRLRGEFGPQGRQFLRDNGDRGLSFGLDMAERGINFGLRYANGRATPADARRFGIDMGRRGRAFGLETRDRAVEFGDDAGQRLPVDGRDTKFNETPGDITIDAPPIPLGRSAPQPKIYGRDLTDRPVRFRREF